MNYFQTAAERLTGILSDQFWQPRRAHIEGARNDLAKAGTENERLRAALAGAREQLHSAQRDTSAIDAALGHQQEVDRAK